MLNDNALSNGDESGSIDQQPSEALLKQGEKDSQAQSPLERDDWINLLPSTDHVDFFRSRDWEQTLLGPTRGWKLGLRLHCFTLFADSRAACLWWNVSSRGPDGPSKVAIYNQHFAVLAGGAHPMLMGSTFLQGFPELWDDIRHEFDKAEASGVAAAVYEIPLFPLRNGFVEETYFTGNFNPVRELDGAVGGFYNSTHEVTMEKINKRRLAMLNLMTIPSGLHKGTLADYIMPSLVSNEIDITMAILYEAVDDTTPGMYRVNLCGNIGVPAGHDLAVEGDLSSSLGLIPLLRKARSEILTLPVDERLQGISWRGFHEASNHFSILPLSGAGRLFGFLVLGLNSRRAVDEDHHQFMRDISSKASSVAASVVSSEESRRRADRIEKELKDSERQIRYMAQNASVGMQHISVDGHTLWANEKYYELTGHPQHDDTGHKMSFIDVFHDEDRVKALDSWDCLTQGELNHSIELRLKRLFTPPSGVPEPACILALSFPYIEEGKVKSIMICTTDISQLKWAESVETRKATDAREAKRQQEEFIDIVSHEMRNPLSAIFQCADLIQASLAKFQSDGSSNESLLEALRSNADAAATILMCANHQKRIVDDVLTLSKLDFMMLSVSPRPVQPITLVQRSVKMFESDLQMHGIRADIVCETSIRDLDIDWILFDPSRVSQILINLLTNAIKFVKSESTRKIAIHFGAALLNPRDLFPSDINWAPAQKETEEEDPTTGAEWGDGESLYLSISVIDTGVGMTPDEIKRLFNRFKQASSKTSIRYGGSGLGLFISQRLAEKQGGEIGVASPGIGKGSRFGFYIKARRTRPRTGALRVQAQAQLPLLPTNRIDIRPAPATNGVRPEKIHVLLVEDNLVNQKVLSKQLISAGCVVYVANHGVEALELLRTTDIWHEQTSGSKPLDIILMDWEMPVMDGLTCTREIRSLQRDGKVLRHMDIIATTANARDEQIQMALDSGVDSVMSKPFMVSDLLLRMRETLNFPP